LVKWLSGGIIVDSVKTEEVLLEAFVEGVEDRVRGSQFENDGGIKTS